MKSDILYVKNCIFKILFLEKEMLSRQYITLYIEELYKIDTLYGIKLWINKYRHIFSIYGKEDIDKIYKNINT